jgi:PTH2 family peptidyl-tRNA hydrolase
MAEKRSTRSTVFKYKQVIVLRTDLKMSKGKLAAQVAHAAVSAVEKARTENASWLKAWFSEGQCKIVVRAESKQQLLELEKQATKSEIPVSLVMDRGLTELPPGTITCLGIGPAPSSRIDKITGQIPLF